MYLNANLELNEGLHITDKRVSLCTFLESFSSFIIMCYDFQWQRFYDVMLCNQLPVMPHC